MFFWKKTKKLSNGEATPEVSRSLRVMKDDLETLPEHQEAKQDSLAPKVPTPSIFARLATPKEGTEMGEKPTQTIAQPPFARPPTTLPIQESKTAPSAPLSPPDNRPSPFLSGNGDALKAKREPALPHPPETASAPVVYPNLPIDPGPTAPPKSEMSVKGTILDIHRSSHRGLWMGLVLLLILILVSAGLYFYFFTDRSLLRKLNLPPWIMSRMGEIATDTPSPSLPTTTPDSTKPTPTFSSTQPNFFSLDTESVTKEEVRSALIKLAGEVQASGMRGPIEYIVRDQNYNPLAFPRFAYLAGLELPEDVLKETDENFSLYVYIDGEHPRFGLEVSVKDMTLFKTALTKGEKTLPQAINPLFYDMTTAPKTGLIFRSNSYQGMATRYANVDSSINLSVDYTFRDTTWIVGTSMQSLRAIIDKTAPKRGEESSTMEKTNP